MAAAGGKIVATRFMGVSENEDKRAVIARSYKRRSNLLFGQRLLRCAAQKLIFSPPSQALPGDENVSRFYLKA
jgi:hypothetical protein